MIRTLLFNRVSSELTEGGEELIRVWEESADTLLWVDCVDNQKELEESLLLERFGLHPLAVQDAQRARHPPKLEVFDSHLFILLKALLGNTGEFEFGTIQLAAFLGERFIVTRRSGESPSTNQLWDELLKDPSMFTNGLDMILLRLCRIMVGRYLKKILALEGRLAEIEEEMLSRPNDKLLGELVGYKTSLNKYRRVFLYHVQIFNEFRTNPPTGISEDRIHEINDVYEQQERVGSLASLYYEIAADLIDGYISVASHRLNNIVRVLTVITVLFVPLTFLAGIYGMNFEHMPELSFRYGYFVILGIMAATAILLLYFFRRKRWL